MPKFFNGIFARKGLLKPPSVNIRRSCYAMTMTDGLDAEIQFYGEIVKTRPIDWWTGEPQQGNFIILDEFLEDLKAIEGAKTLLMRIDSIGGDSEVSVTIHNRLRELAAKKTARIDGVAMSGGTHITCAADIIQVNPASQFMIHKCWGFLFGGYNADELRALAETWLDPTDKSQVEIYKERTGKTEEELLAMMSKTATFVGQEIIDAGFADEMLASAYDKPEIAASADGRLLMVNGRPMHMPSFAKLPDGIKTVATSQEDDNNKTQPATTGGQEGGKLMAKNLEELRAENPELANQLMTEAKAAVSTDDGSAVEAERKRIEEIDTISSLYDDETVKEAKYGKTACNAQELAFRAAQKAAKKGKVTLDNMQEDTNASGANDVSAATVTIEEDKPLTPAQRMAAGRADAKKIQNKEDK
ncbi:MAG: Protease subunit of ATP-dependent Clp protease [Eubacterium sp.]|nr:Protease subunit of ATP-dependent Clp protease [Eubacterium sp.]